MGQHFPTAAFPSSQAIFTTPIVNDALASLEEKVQSTAAASQAILDIADKEAREFTDDEVATLEANQTEIDRLERQIKARHSFQPPKSAGRRTTEPGGAGARVEDGSRKVPASPKSLPGQWGYRNLGEFAQTVAHASHQEMPNYEAARNRIQNALTTYANEGTGADGGWAVPPDFRTEIARKVFGEESLLGLTDRMTVSGNAITIPKDETTPWGTTGIQVYWEVEAGQKTQSKPVLGQNQLRLNKVIGLVPVTDELLEDAPGIETYIRSRVPEAMAHKVSTAIVRGNGVGMPLGILNSPSLITVAKDVSQPADSIWYENLVAMYSRMVPTSIPRSRWLINQSVWPALAMMSFDPNSTVKVPIYMPNQSASDTPYGTLFGRPIMPIQATSALGDLGDIILADMSQYLTITKGQDVKVDTSIHLFFDYDVTAFRFVFRVAGQPWWAEAITPEASGAPTLGHFVTLAERA